MCANVQLAEGLDSSGRKHNRKWNRGHRLFHDSLQSSHVPMSSWPKDRSASASAAGRARFAGGFRPLLSTSPTSASFLQTQCWQGRLVTHLKAAELMLISAVRQPACGRCCAHRSRPPAVAEEATPVCTQLGDWAAPHWRGQLRCNTPAVCPLAYSTHLPSASQRYLQRHSWLQRPAHSCAMHSTSTRAAPSIE